jgi:1-acyl-sn-glycerol-3-phosphate acyltransferase
MPDYTPELPPVSNRALYVYRVLVKWISFFVFGLGSLILIIIIFPPMRLILRSRERFKKYGRRLVSFSFRIFVSFMHFLRGLDLEAGSPENYRNLSSKIIVANHPSLLDVVMLLSLIPNADCIINARLSQNIVRGIVCQLYILNSLNFEDLLRACTESLNQGNCLVIFPEGTRTPRQGNVILRRGAARIALASGCNIIPLHIGGTDKYGLGKRDPWTGFNPRDRYVYQISIGDEINPEKYRKLSTPKAVRILTGEMAAYMFPKGESR